MVAEVSSVRQRKPSGFMNQLSSAFCEWFLIFLLFLDSAFSYLLAKFAHYCELKPPCLLCSKLDHVFGEKKPECYWRLLCNNHREEISSLASCSIHGKLADIHGMCEECLTPIALQNKSNNESYRLLVGKLWVDVEKTVLQNLLLNKNIRLGSSIRRTCTCCSKTWRTKSNADRLLELVGVGYGASKANMKPPLPRVPGRSRFSRRDSFKRLRDKITGTSTSSSGDKLSHVGYTKLKLSSDSESEFPYSEDDDDGNASSRSKNYDERTESYVRVRRRKSLPPKLTGRIGSDTEAQEISVVKPVTIDQPNLLDLSYQNNVNSSTSDALIDHGLKEINWEESYDKGTTCLTQELISLDDEPKQPDVSGGSSGELWKSNASFPYTTTISILSELLSLYNDPSFSNQKKTINIGGTEEEGIEFVPKDLTKASSETSSDVAHSLEPNDTNLIDISSQNVGQTEPHTLEPINVSDSAKIEEDTESVAPVSICETGLALKDDSPRAYGKHELSRKDENSPKMKEDTKPVEQVSISEAEFSSKDGILPACEKHKLSRKDENSPKTKEDTKPVEQVSISEVEFASKGNSLHGYETNELSGKDENSPKTKEDMMSVEQVSIAEDESESKVSSPRDHEQNNLSREDEDSPKIEEDTKFVPQVSSTSEAGSGSEKTTPRAHEKRELSQKDEDSLKTEENTKLVPPVSSISEAGSGSEKSSPRAHEKHELAQKDEDSLRTEEDTKLVAPVSSIPEVGSALKEISPRAHEKCEEYKKDGDSKSQNSASLKRNDSSFESLDGMSVHHIEGESIVDRLRRQVEQGKTTISSLYKELEEERNAAAVAANQAMAMITRLQEEKAALHMEALQYLRMMEEQAEYDMEALERANDLLAEKEKELQDLESELEFYRDNLVQESSGVEDIQKDILAVENKHVVQTSSGDSKKTVKANGECKLMDNSNFEDEKNYIVECLKKLQKKLHQSSSCGDQRLNGVSDMLNGLHSEKIKETGLDPHEDSPPNEETLSKQENGIFSLNGNLNNDSKKDFYIDLTTFEKEISELHYRLEVLEIERDVLKHASNLLPNGKDGLHFIQEIAHQLQALREIGFKKR